ncbi:protein of unknown function [Georgfuchsia toluolica]|uniref:Uncharacterized protein n=1 Tax=Georgfuchsia toluolica TaxID=424218 RepID=A0A916J584_9PROT|nr:protein of unknown function [Georgfuchsia toluolica]
MQRQSGCQYSDPNPVLANPWCIGLSYQNSLPSPGQFQIGKRLQYSSNKTLKLPGSPPLSYIASKIGLSSLAPPYVKVKYKLVKLILENRSKLLTLGRVTLFLPVSQSLNFEEYDISGLLLR